jgi:hypothetical protein
MADFTIDEIATLLEPFDAQNVPVALRLVRALKKIAEIPKERLSPAQQKDQIALTAFSEMFGSFVEAMFDHTLSLKDQMTQLAKFALMMACFFPKDGADSICGQLYYDCISCVKNVFVCLAKQQDLDPDQPFFQFLLGTDGVEKLFAMARMIGRHNPNFNITEFARLLGHAMDILRIFSDHPDWYSGHRRTSTEFGARADHLYPEAWLSAFGRSFGGLGQIYATTGEWVEWPPFWAKRPGTTIMCPRAADVYPGIKARGTSGSASVPRDERDRSQDFSVDSPPYEPRTVLSGLASAQVERTLSTRAAKAAESSSTSSASLILSSELEEQIALVQSFSADTQDSDVLAAVDAAPAAAGYEGSSRIPGSESVLRSVPVPEAVMQTELSESLDSSEIMKALSRKQEHSQYIDGKWVHNQSIAKDFNTNPQPKQSKDRWARIRGFAARIVSDPLRGITSDSFLVGQHFAAVVRCDQGAFLAIMRATHLFQSGQSTYGVRPLEIHIPARRIEIWGQVLSVTCDSEQSDTSNSPVLSLDTSGAIVYLRDFRSTARAADVLTLKVLGVSTIPLQILPPARSSDDADSSWIAGFTHTALEDLRSKIWQQIKDEHSKKLAACSLGDNFPYQLPDGAHFKARTCTQLILMLQGLWPLHALSISRLRMSALAHNRGSQSSILSPILAGDS